MVGDKEETEVHGQEMGPSHTFHHGNDQDGSMDPEAVGPSTKGTLNPPPKPLINQ